MVSQFQVPMAVLCVPVRPRSLRVYSVPEHESDDEIRERHLKHIAEITKDLDKVPIQSEDLTYEQQEWMRRKMRSGFTKPVRDQLTELENRGWKRTKEQWKESS